MSVDILMATYNGGRHLRKQLLSLQLTSRPMKIGPCGFEMMVPSMILYTFCVSLPDMTVESRLLKKISEGILGQGKIFWV